ncbi:MAG: hypothetical protein KJ818_06520 [Candidatus Omnitrophica bacterium]|nr:hypothetical protein [Candidatus Omnitrophota bacterium]
MLSEEEKREMLEDALSKARRDDFRLAGRDSKGISFDSYLSFLNNIQKVFSAFQISRYRALTELNKF